MADVGGLVMEASHQSALEDVYSTSNLIVMDHACAGGLINVMCDSRLKKAYSRGFIQGGDHTTIGGLVQACEQSYIADAYSMSRIAVGRQGQAGGLIGVMHDAQLERAYFAGTLKGPANAAIGAIWGKREKNKTGKSKIPGRFTATYWHEDKLTKLRTTHPKCFQERGQYEAKTAAEFAEVSTFQGWFERSAWMMGSKRPKLLPWQKRQDAFILLRYLNSFGYFKASIANLPLELEILVFSYVQPHGQLDHIQIGRLIYYASAPIEFIALFQNKYRAHWTKKEFLNYVCRGDVPLVVGTMAESSKLYKSEHSTKKKMLQILKKPWSLHANAKKQ